MSLSQYYTQSWLHLNILTHTHTYPRPVFALEGAANGNVPAEEKSPTKAKKHKGLDDGIVQGHGLCLHVFADVGRTSTLPRSIYKVTSGHSSGFLNGDMPGETIL